MVLYHLMMVTTSPDSQVLTKLERSSRTPISKPWKEIDSKIGHDVSEREQSYTCISKQEQQDPGEHHQ